MTSSENKGEEIEQPEQTLGPWMRRCLALAEDARGCGDDPVGAVIVRDGTTVAEASEQVRARRDVTAHAELIVIQQACATLGTLDLTGCTLITNVEPCWMCSFAIREAGITEVVIGEAVAGIGGVTSGYPILTDDKIGGWEPPPRVVWLRLQAEFVESETHRIGL